MMAPKFSFFAFLFSLSLLPLIGSSALFYILSENRNLFENLSLPEILLFFAVMVITMALAFTPTTFVAFISGYLFSWMGFPLMVIAYLLSSAIGLSLGKLLSKGILEKITSGHPKWKLFVASMEKRMLSLVVFSRLSPVMPFAMVNVALSALTIRKQTFFLGTVLGMLPRTLLFFWLGKNATEILAFFENPSGDGILKLIPVVLVVISLGGIGFLARKSWKETIEH